MKGPNGLYPIIRRFRRPLVPLEDEPDETIKTPTKTVETPVEAPVAKPVEIPPAEPARVETPSQPVQPVSVKPSRQKKHGAEIPQASAW